MWLNEKIYPIYIYCSTAIYAGLLLAAPEHMRCGWYNTCSSSGFSMLPTLMSKNPRLSSPLDRWSCTYVQTEHKEEMYIYFLLWSSWRSLLLNEFSDLCLPDTSNFEIKTQSRVKCDARFIGGAIDSGAAWSREEDHNFVQRSWSDYVYVTGLIVMILMTGI